MKIEMKANRRLGVNGVVAASSAKNINVASAWRKPMLYGVKIWRKKKASIAGGCAKSVAWRIGGNSRNENEKRQAKTGSKYRRHLQRKLAEKYKIGRSYAHRRGGWRQQTGATGGGAKLSGVIARILSLARRFSVKNKAKKSGYLFINKLSRYRRQSVMARRNDKAGTQRWRNKRKAQNNERK